MLKWLAQLGFTPKDILVIAAVFFILFKIGVLKIRIGKNGIDSSVNFDSLDNWLRSQEKTAEQIASSSQKIADTGATIIDELQDFKEKFIELAAVIKERMPRK